jgi:hypothetical protein
MSTRISGSRRAARGHGVDDREGLDKRESSGRVGRVDLAGDLRAALALDQRNVVLALQVGPELRPGAEVAAEADRGVRP